MRTYNAIALLSFVEIEASRKTNENSIFETGPRLAGDKGRVVNTEDDTFRILIIKAVPHNTVFVSAPDFAMGSFRKMKDRKKRGLPMLMERIIRAGGKGFSMPAGTRRWFPGF